MGKVLVDKGCLARLVMKILWCHISSDKGPELSLVINFDPFWWRGERDPFTNLCPFLSK